MGNLQDVFEKRKPPFISAFSSCMTVTYQDYLSPNNALVCCIKSPKLNLL